MPPNSDPLTSAQHPTVPMRRGAPSGAAAGSTVPLAVHRSEFEDFMNAYRPTVDISQRREPETPKGPPEDKVDLGRSIKKLIKRPQGSPSVQSKNNRVQRTSASTTSSRTERERSVVSDTKPTPAERKPKRPLSAHVDVALTPPPSAFGQGPTVMLPLEANLSKSKPPQPPSRPPPPVPPKLDVEDSGVAEGVGGGGSTPPATLAVPPMVPNPSPAKKKVSLQEEKRRSGTESLPDAHCLIISTHNIGRFLPPRHNPDPILSLRVVPIPERKYHVILEFEESPAAPRPRTSSSGLMVVMPEEMPRVSREQREAFACIRDSHVATTGFLLANVERITEFPYIVYLVVPGARHDLYQKLNVVRDRPIPARHQQLHFLAGYEEAVTVCRPSMSSTFPERPSSDKAGFIVSLYQVLPGDDGLRFEQNWVVWTGARQIYRTAPEWLGLKRISVHKSVVPNGIINYALLCECTNILDNLTDACLVIDHLRARCCGFTGIYRIIDAL